MGLLELMGEGIAEAKKTYVLGKRTMSLFYAADFADQVGEQEKSCTTSGLYSSLLQIYLYSMARDAVRGN